MTRLGRPPFPDVLTPREQEVHKMLRQGLTNAQIADRLGITLDGAKYHVSEIMGKLGARSREDAAAVAVRGYRPWWLAAFAPFWPLGRRFRVDFTSVAAVAAGVVVAAAVAGLAVLGFFVLRTGDDNGSPGAGANATATPLPQAFDGFAQQLDAALEAGDRTFFIDNVVFQDVVCGTAQGPPGYPASCQGLPAGSTSPGLPVSVLQSEGQYDEPGDYGQRIDALFKNNDAVRLHATATLGVAGWPEFEKYDEVRYAITAGPPPLPDTPGPALLVFTLGYDGAAWRVIGLIVGAPDVFLVYDTLQPGDDWADLFATWERWPG